MTKECTRVLVDPEAGWMYGFPKWMPFPTEDVNQWLWDNGYPKGKVPYYVRYIEVTDK